MKRTLLHVCGVLLLAGSTFAQTTNLGVPVSWDHQLKSLTTSAKKTMPGFDLAAVQAEDAINDAAKSSPWRFGYKYNTDFSLENSGTWTEFADGSRLWRLELEAPGAITMNLLLENVYIPAGGQLYLFDKAQTNRVGAYTYRNNREDGELGTELVFGDDIIVEYFEPSYVNETASLTISNVIHGYRTLDPVQQQLMKGLNTSGACNIDVHCPLGDLWWNQIRSVAMIVVGGNGACTGALINNSCNDGKAYFLTANHCLGGSTGFWAFRFNWQSPEGTESCATVANSSNSAYDQTANGATILASGTQADHALLEIDNMTVQDAIDYGAFYAGWNNDDTPGSITQATGIHHPDGDLKKICREDDSPTQQNAGGAAVWWISEWEQGVTEPGSSGSPLFDQNGRIIGQLFGGAAACAGTSNNGAHDFYGRLGISWNLGFKQYLDPSSCGGSNVTNDGYDPNPATADIKVIPSIEFTVSPNPSTGIFTLEMATGTPLSGELTVHDMTGRQVYSASLDQILTQTIDLSAVENGTYVLRVNSASATSTRSIVVNK